MATPLLRDDGHSVFLDLHGLPVENALSLAQAVVFESVKRGRSSVEIVHGSSTSSKLFRNYTIKHALLDWLEQDPPQSVKHYICFDNKCILSLPLASDRDARLLDKVDFDFPFGESR